VRCALEHPTYPPIITKASSAVATPTHVTEFSSPCPISKYEWPGCKERKVWCGSDLQEFYRKCPLDLREPLPCLHPCKARHSVICPPSSGICISRLRDLMASCGPLFANRTQNGARTIDGGSSFLAITSERMKRTAGQPHPKSLGLRSCQRATNVKINKLVAASLCVPQSGM
jgi:hypothetical protein